MNYKIAIIDDNFADTEYVAALVARWAQPAGYAIGISAFPSAEAFLFRYEDEQDFDILLLDIEMGELNGVDLAKRVRQGKCGSDCLYHRLSGFYCRGV